MPTPMSSTRRRRVGALSIAGAILCGTFGAAPPAQAAPVRYTAPLRVVALGDSVPSGGHCRCAPYPTQVARDLGRRQARAVRVHNDAVSGATSADVRTDVTDPAVALDVRHADLVILTVGANDFDERKIARCATDPAGASCYAPQLRALRANLAVTIARVTRTQRLARSEVVVTGYWNVFKDGAVGRARGSAYVRGSDRLTRIVNDTITSVAKANNAIYVDAYAPFKGAAGKKDCTALLAADGDHPNGAGHAVMAKAIVTGLGTKAALV